MIGGAQLIAVLLVAAFLLCISVNCDVIHSDMDEAEYYHQDLIHSDMDEAEYYHRDLIHSDMDEAEYYHDGSRDELMTRDLLRGNLNQGVIINQTTRDLKVTYRPGYFSDGKTSDDGMVHISDGLSCKRIATSGKKVRLANGKVSSEPFHAQPDGAAVFKSKNGGWYYVSNAEVDKVGMSWKYGGVGAIRFDADGNVIGYKKILHGTKKNCGGGKTPWGSWITCEESSDGKVWQVDPVTRKKTRLTALGTLGKYESFAYDTSTSRPTFYVTRDSSNGVVTRFIPNDKGMECYKKKSNYDRWCTLENGDRDYLVLSGGSSGTFKWTKNEREASENAKKYFPGNEGIDAARGRVYFVSKDKKRLIILDLKRQKYTYSSTKSGAFNTEPDQVELLVRGDESILYFCEDGGASSGVYGRNSRGRYYTVMIGRTDKKGDETTGLAFGRNYKNMYVSYQEGGFIYDCTRDDGHPFNGELLDIKYHAS